MNFLLICQRIVKEAVPRGGIKRRKTSVADQESGVALCHRVALKKKDRSRTIESGVALCHEVALKKNDWSRTERAVSLCATG